jgi:hypothetical protein
MRSANVEAKLKCPLLGNNRLDDAKADRVIKLLRSTYADFGPTLAAEKLRTKHGIDLARGVIQIGFTVNRPRSARRHQRKALNVYLPRDLHDLCGRKIEPVHDFDCVVI